ncbi:uncharacterized protein LOC135395981 [Ornithodoros turicata]|uniref:uncharacterized protein LOC135395981 n=1 Tax=Ornithodoros turicata TaxID=34597 RepID=UPI0031393C68
MLKQVQRQKPTSPSSYRSLRQWENEGGWTCSTRSLNSFFGKQHIYQYTEKHGAGKHKDDGLRLFTSGHVQELKFFEDDCSPDTLVRADILASMQTSVTYRVRTVIDKATGNICWGACKCSAGGLGVCKHVCCCLYALVYVTTHELKAFPQRKSCTEGPRQWYTPRDPKVVSRTIDALDFVKDTTERLSCAPERYARKRKYSSLDENRRVMSSMQLDSIEQRCRAIGMDCLADVICGNGCRPEPLPTNPEEQENLPETWLQLFQTSGMSATYSLQEVAQIELVTRGQSKCALWSKYRRGMITASIAHRVFTWMKSVDNKPRPHNAGPLIHTVLMKQSMQTAAMKRGLDMEPVAKASYLDKHADNHRNLQIAERGLCVLTGCPFVGASPDGIIQCECCEAKILEVKCPVSVQRLTQQHLRSERLKATSQFYTQMQIQMGATSISSGVLFIYQDDGPSVEVPVQFDKAYYITVMKSLRSFYSEYVATCITTA